MPPVLVLIHHFNCTLNEYIRHLFTVAGDKPGASLDDGGQRQRDAIDGPVPSVTEEEEDGEAEKEMYEEGQEVEEDEPCVGTPEEEEVNVEWPAGVPQASDKDLAKLSNTEEVRVPLCSVVTRLIITNCSGSMI